MCYRVHTISCFFDTYEHKKEFTHTVSMVTEECSEILACVNDSPGHTGEDVKNSLAVIY